MSLASQYAPRYTVEDYSNWKGDWELWEGLAIAMTPSPFGRHQQVLFNLAFHLRTAIQQSNCPANVLGELDWIVSKHTVVRPDLMILCGPVPEQHLTCPPALVAEILSASTRSSDLGFKKQLYCQQGVQTYLIVDTEQSKIEAWIMNDKGEYELMRPEAELRLTVCQNCQIQIPIDRVFAA
jgi:Uma2 family endonuclease